MTGILKPAKSSGSINIAERFPLTFEPFRTASIAGSRQQQYKRPAQAFKSAAFSLDGQLLRT
jgi:hypothetical protein